MPSTTGRSGHLTLVLVSFSVVLASCTPPPDNWEPLIGVWEYRQANAGSATGFDPEGERLELVRAGGSVSGTYFGLEREGEHGLFYTATEVSGLVVDDGGTIRLTVPARTLFSKRPASLADAGAAQDARAGFTRERLTLTGRIEDGNLVLYCAGDGNACPDRVMAFRQSAWP